MDVSFGRFAMTPAFTVYTAALSLKYVRAPGPPGGSRGDQLLFCSFSFSPSVKGVFPLGICFGQPVSGGFPFGTLGQETKGTVPITGIGHRTQERSLVVRRYLPYFFNSVLGGEMSEFGVRRASCTASSARFALSSGTRVLQFHVAGGD